ncbi:MAG TPA: hypothetical protein VFF67_06590 [Thermoplasmata archaeon]|nr:hypothetical protein [Thermoplasmata archaeon]
MSSNDAQGQRDGAGRWLGAATVGTVVSVGLLLLLSPYAAASTAGSLKAPYAGAVSSGQNSVYASGCAKAKNLVLAHWNATTGKGASSESAMGKTCANQIGNAGVSSSSSADGAVSIAIPITLASNGYYHFQASWSLHVSNARTLTPGTCAKTNAKSASCSGYAETGYSAYASVYDSTNGSASYPSAVCWQTSCSSNSYWYSFNETYNRTTWSSGVPTYSNGSQAYNVPGNHLTFFINTSIPLLTNHTYLLELYLDVWAGIGLTSYNTYLHNATAAATANAASLGNFVKLAGVSWK